MNGPLNRQTVKERPRLIHSSSYMSEGNGGGKLRIDIDFNLGKTMVCAKITNAQPLC